VPPIIPFVCTSCPRTLAAARLRQQVTNKDQSFCIVKFSLSETNTNSIALRIDGPDDAKQASDFHEDVSEQLNCKQIGETGEGVKNDLTERSSRPV
jgi:hypothetical protein